MGEKCVKYGLYNRYINHPFEYGPSKEKMPRPLAWGATILHMLNGVIN